MKRILSLVLALVLVFAVPIGTLSLHVFSTENITADPIWELGTILAASGMNGSSDTRLRTVEHLRLSDYIDVTVKEDYQITWLAYDADKHYIGNGTETFTGKWLAGGEGISTAEILSVYENAVFFRIAMKSVATNTMTLADVEMSGITFRTKAEGTVMWEQGTISSATGLNNDNPTRLRTAAYLLLEDYGGVGINRGYTMTDFVYDKDYHYLGTSSWLGSGIGFETEDLQEKYPDAVYFRIALRTEDSKTISVADAEASGITFYGPDDDVPARDDVIKHTVVGNIGSWQDGAIFDGKLFVFNRVGDGAVYDLNTMTKLSAVSLDRKDVLTPHSNSVCFSNTYYAQGDRYPLLYINVYNNYASSAERMEGTCCVYRLTETDGVFTTDLVQVIRIGFVEDLTLWKSKEDNGDTRPYGNFVVDTDHNKLYAYVMRDADNTTRFFRFDLPALTDGIYNDTYGCNVVTLESGEIESYFDTSYFHYLQGGCYSDGRILSVEGFSDGAFRIVDLNEQKVIANHSLAEAGLVHEPEILCTDPATGILYYAAVDGILRTLTIPDWESGHSHSYTSVVTLPSCTEKGYTTYTCSLCSDSYRTPWLDKTAYAGKTIACVGDSITAAYGVTKDKTDYVTLLAQQLDMNYIRLGASGTTLCTDGSRTCNIGQLTEGRLNGADVVTILMGINDFANAGADYYELGDIHSTDTSTIYGAMRMWCERIAELRKTDSLRDTQFYFITPLITSWNNSVTSKRDWDQSKTTIHGYTLRDLCNAIIEVAALYDVATIDLNLLSGMYYVDATDNNTSVFGGDGVHPGEKGHEMMADALANVLLQNNLRDDHEHAFGSWITTTWPSCLAGEQQRVCAICSATEGRTLTPSNDHRYYAVITAPTYTQQGYTTYTCSSCGDRYVSDYTDALRPNSYRWEMQDNALVSVTTDGNTANALTTDNGSVTNGTLTNIRYRLQNAVRLYHHIPWAIEWRSTGNWSGMLFSSTVQSPSDGLIYLFRDRSTNLFAFGEYNGNWNNYGTILDCDMTVPHIFRLENRIAADGTNTVYLLVDGREIDAMHHYYKIAANQNTTVNWANGKDLAFANIGTSSHPVSGMKLEYLQVWESIHTHSYTSVVTLPTCTKRGYTTYTCDCGEHYVDDYVDATGHRYTDGVCTLCGVRQTSTFQILDTRCNQIETFTYEIGMTWREWLNSKYNTGMGSCIAIWVSAGPDILGKNPHMDIFVNGRPAGYDDRIYARDELELIRYN